MKLLIIHNIAISYYKNIVFNSLYNKFKSFKVIHLAETQKNREWEIDLSSLNYPFEVLFKGNLDDINKIKLTKSLIKKLKKEDFDIIYLGGYSEIAYWTALIFSKFLKKKIVLEMDSNIYNLGKKTFYKEFFKKIFVKMCDYGITYSSLSKYYFIKLGMPEKKIIIKPNVTDNEYWEKESEKYSKEKDKIIKEEGFKSKNFIYVGRFAPEKNLFFLLDAFKKIKEDPHTNQWGLILVGGGILEEELKKYVEKEKIKDVFFIPFKQKDELPKYYAISDVLILPSLSETWGIVVNEAMMSGLIPVISKRCGARDLIKNSENGFLFDPTQKEELISVMKKVISAGKNINFIKKINKRKIDRINSEYASDKIIELINLIENQREKIK